jgi:hypothetical protein
MSVENTSVHGLQSYLNSLSLAELQDLVLSKLNHDPSFSTDIELFQKRQSGSERDVASYQEEALSYFNALNTWAEAQDSLRVADASDFVEGQLKELLETANHSLYFGGWVEAVRIYQGILLASAGHLQGEGRDVKTQAVRLLVGKVLSNWSAVIGNLSFGKARDGAVLAFLAFFLEEDLKVGEQDWENAFRRLVFTAAQATSLLEDLNQELENLGRKLKELEKQAEKASALLFLYELSGMNEEYLELAQRWFRKLPYWTLSLARFQLSQGLVEEAGDTVKSGLRALDNSRYHKAREEALRFSVRELEHDDETLNKQAIRLVLDYQQESDFNFLMGLLRNPEARSNLLLEVQRKTNPRFALSVLQHNSTLETILNFAGLQVHSDILPELVQLLSQRYPEESFELFKSHLLGLLKSNSGANTYGRFPALLQEMSQIPGHGEKTRDFASHLAKKYKQRYKLREALMFYLDAGSTAHLEEGEADDSVLQAAPPEVKELPEVFIPSTPKPVKAKKSRSKKTTVKAGGKAPNARAQRRRKKKRAPGNEYSSSLKLQGETRKVVKELEKLMASSPITDEHKDRLQAAGITWQPGIIRLIWAALKFHGGEMNGKDITEWIMFMRGCGKNSTAALRSLGLKALQFIGLVEVERVKNRVTKVILL